jgi:hypothetical protein
VASEEKTSGATPAPGAPIQEAGTDALNLKLKLEAQGPQDSFISIVGHAEIFALLARRLRENLLRQEEFDLI